MTQPSTPPMKPRRPTGPQVFLGIFIVWQLFFLVSINLIGLAQDARDELSKDTKAALEPVTAGWSKRYGHLHDLAEVVYGVDKRWAQLTGQIQGWSLFAPDVDHQSIFPAVELRWDDGPPLSPGTDTPTGATRVFLRSVNEPEDIEGYFRFGGYRLRRYESRINLILRPWPEETAAETDERWRGSVREHVREQGDYLKAYLQWRVSREAPADRPPPRQVILLMRRYAISEPEQAPPYWDGPHTAPVARWSPGSGRPDLEAYNPVLKRFESIK